MAPAPAATPGACCLRLARSGVHPTPEGITTRGPLTRPTKSLATLRIAFSCRQNSSGLVVEQGGIDHTKTLAMTSTWSKLVTSYVNFLNRYRIVSAVTLLAVLIVTVVYAPLLLSAVGGAKHRRVLLISSAHWQCRSNRNAMAVLTAFHCRACHFAD